VKAIAIATPGGPEVLTLVEHPEPRHGEGECRIRVHASGINRPDVLQRKGLYPPPPGVSELPGLEVAGVIEAGDEAALASVGLKVGDAVCALLAGGGYAEVAVAPVGQCLPVPAGLSMAEAASLPETFYTVWSNLFEQAGLRAGQRLLVHGGSSGIGITAIQLAKAFGAQVWVTVGNAEKAAACVALGADGAINYTTQDFVAEGLQATGGQGFDLILDMVGGPYIARDQQVLAEGGRLLVISLLGGPKGEIDAGLLLRKGQHISGSRLRGRSLVEKADLTRQLREHVWPLMVQRVIKPVLHRTYAALDAAQAHRDLEASQHIGKLVLVWQGD
jgi:NADPH:quinone reductase